MTSVLAFHFEMSNSLFVYGVYLQSIHSGTRLQNLMQKVMLRAFARAEKQSLGTKNRRYNKFSELLYPVIFQ